MGEASDGTVDPRGSESGYGRTVRGGSYSDGASACDSADRRRRPAPYQSNEVGFRVLLPIRASSISRSTNSNR
jgi:hypothetical protein